MTNRFKPIFSVPGLRSRVFFTLSVLGVFLVGRSIPAPGLDAVALSILAEQADGTMLREDNTFSGGQLSIFALGIMPYIAASGFLQLLSLVWPYLARLSKEGEPVRRKITRWTRYLTFGLSIMQSIAFAGIVQQSGLASNPGIGFTLTTVLTLTTGTAFIVWLGDQVSERGVGNGMALIVVAGIVAGLPSAVQNVYANVFATGQPAQQYVNLALILGATIAFVAVVLWVERHERWIPMHCGGGVAGQRMIGGHSTHLSLRLNPVGVMPVIFASWILSLPQTLLVVSQDSPTLTAIVDSISYGMPLYYLMYVGAIIFFVFVYTAIIFNSNEVADNIQEYGGLVPRIRSGKPTADHIKKIVTKVTLVAGVYLALISVVPDVLTTGIQLHHVPLIGDWADNNLPRWFLEGLNVNFYFGGASLLIIVGVTMDTVKQIEAQLKQPDQPARDGSDRNSTRVETETVSSADGILRDEHSTTAEYEKFVPVLTPRGALMASFVASLLQSAEIRFFIKNERVQDLFGLGRVGTGFNVFTGAQAVCVEPTRAEEATELLGSIKAE